MSIGIIIQARIDSDRFPKKVLKLIEGKPILWHVINQCKKTNLEIIVATTKRKMDDPIIDIAKSSKVRWFRGSKNDVLDRYYHASKKFKLKLIVRITADCPIIDPNESIKVVRVLKSKKVDYVALDDKTYPDGLDTEGFTFESLEKAWRNANLSSEREHVTPYIQKNEFRKKIIVYRKNLSHLRFTVDYKDDFEFLKSLCLKMKNKKNINLKQVLKVLEKNPELTRINSSHKRNEGYQKSIRNDRIITN